MEDRCVCCGKIVPEGRQICWNCENHTKTLDDFRCEKYFQSPLDVSCFKKVKNWKTRWNRIILKVF